LSEPINNSVSDESPAAGLDGITSDDAAAEAPSAALAADEAGTEAGTEAEAETEAGADGSPTHAGMESGVDRSADADDAGSTEGGPSNHKGRLVAEGDIAADYLEGLVDIADLDGDIDMDIDGDRAAVSISGGDLGHLVGRNGEVLDALQELTRLAVLRETGERSRLMLDIEGHRARRRIELTEIGAQAAEKVKSSGEPVSLPAMTPFERKIVHDAIAVAGLVSESEGVEPMRYVVVHPA